ncbi:carbonic anhydrase [Streptomyces liangshanensis]|uniref:carbonic anhydrase n=1 Tax=Streptomyces liangshanensis TaxID=2717324 RepID=UPI0036DEFAD5
MGAVETLTGRNKDFAESRYDASLRMRPTLATIVIGCVDARVDPAVVLGAAPGEIMAIRNVGGRVTPHALDELFILRNVARAVGDDIDPGWDLIVMHHTQCGITRVHDRPDLLAPYFGVAEDQLDTMRVGNPYDAVALDVSVLRADERLAGARVSGLVYDVTTGRVRTVVEP